MSEAGLSFETAIRRTALLMLPWVEDWAVLIRDVTAVRFVRRADARAGVAIVGSVIAGCGW